MGSNIRLLQTHIKKIILISSYPDYKSIHHNLVLSIMADGKNNHTRKELDTKHDTNTMDDVEFRKWKLKEIHRRTLLPVFDPMWVEHTLAGGLNPPR